MSKEKGGVFGKIAAIAFILSICLNILGAVLDILRVYYENTMFKAESYILIVVGLMFFLPPLLLLVTGSFLKEGSAAAKIFVTTGCVLEIMLTFFCFLINSESISHAMSTLEWLPKTLLVTDDLYWILLLIARKIFFIIDVIVMSTLSFLVLQSIILGNLTKFEFCKPLALAFSVLQMIINVIMALATILLIAAALIAGDDITGSLRGITIEVVEFFYNCFVAMGFVFLNIAGIKKEFPVSTE